jgi:hypothetical protein
MKVKITYEIDGSINPETAYWARSGEEFACGTSFEAARDRLIIKLRVREALRKGSVPPPEEVEI